MLDDEDVAPSPIATSIRMSENEFRAAIAAWSNAATPQVTLSAGRVVRVPLESLEESRQLYYSYRMNPNEWSQTTPAQYLEVGEPISINTPETIDEVQTVLESSTTAVDGNTIINPMESEELIAGMPLKDICKVLRIYGYQIKPSITPEDLVATRRKLHPTTTLPPESVYELREYFNKIAFISAYDEDRDEYEDDDDNYDDDYDNDEHYDEPEL